MARGNLPWSRSSPACTGPIAQIFIADTTDLGHPYAGSVAARQRTLAADDCAGTATAVYNPGPNARIPNSASQCLTYRGCPAAYPVVFCTTVGQAQTDEQPLAVGAFWNFFLQF